HGGQRGQAEASADLLEARCVAVLTDELVQVVENLTLPFRQWEHGRNYTQKKGEGQIRMRPARIRKCGFRFVFRPRDRSLSISAASAKTASIWLLSSPSIRLLIPSSACSASRGCPAVR